MPQALEDETTTDDIIFALGTCYQRHLSASSTLVLNLKGGLRVQWVTTLPNHSMKRSFTPVNLPYSKQVFLWNLVSNSAQAMS